MVCLEKDRQQQPWLVSLSLHIKERRVQWMLFYKYGHLDQPKVMGFMVTIILCVVFVVISAVPLGLS